MIEDETTETLGVRGLIHFKDKFLVSSKKEAAIGLSRIIVLLGIFYLRKSIKS